MERGGRKMRETGDKAKRKKGGEGRKESRERERRRGVGEYYPLHPPSHPPHRFRDSFFLFRIINAHHSPVI
jgi:hypothetical protein